MYMAFQLICDEAETEYSIGNGQGVWKRTANMLHAQSSIFLRSTIAAVLYITARLFNKKTGPDVLSFVLADFQCQHMCDRKPILLTQEQSSQTIALWCKDPYYSLICLEDNIWTYALFKFILRAFYIVLCGKLTFKQRYLTFFNGHIFLSSKHGKLNISKNLHVNINQMQQHTLPQAVLERHDSLVFWLVTTGIWRENSLYTWTCILG